MEDGASHPLLHGLYDWSETAVSEGVCDREFTRYIEEGVMESPLNIETGNIPGKIRMTTLTSERFKVVSPTGELVSWYEVEVEGRKQEMVEEREDGAFKAEEVEVVGTHGGTGKAMKASPSFWHSAEDRVGLERGSTVR